MTTVYLYLKPYPAKSFGETANIESVPDVCSHAVCPKWLTASARSSLTTDDPRHVQTCTPRWDFSRRLSLCLLVIYRSLENIEPILLFSSTLLHAHTCRHASNADTGRALYCQETVWTNGILENKDPLIQRLHELAVFQWQQIRGLQVNNRSLTPPCLFITSVPFKLHKCSLHW